MNIELANDSLKVSKSEKPEVLRERAGMKTGQEIYTVVRVCRETSGCAYIHVSGFSGILPPSSRFNGWIDDSASQQRPIGSGYFQ